MNTPQGKPVALMIGAGDATGGAVARRFAREGFAACVTRRSADKSQPVVDSIRAEGGILAPDHIVDTSWFLHQQPRDAWTFELDLRPWSERW